MAKLLRCLPQNLWQVAVTTWWQCQSSFQSFWRYRHGTTDRLHKFGKHVCFLECCHRHRHVNIIMYIVYSHIGLCKHSPYIGVPIVKMVLMMMMMMMVMMTMMMMMMMILTYDTTIHNHQQYSTMYKYGASCSSSPIDGCKNDPASFLRPKAYFQGLWLLVLGSFDMYVYR